jgi:hypothetical protein
MFWHTLLFCLNEITDQDHEMITFALIDHFHVRMAQSCSQVNAFKAI